MLLSALPRAIRTEAEYDRIAALVTRLALKGEDDLTPEEEALIEMAFFDTSPNAPAAVQRASSLSSRAPEFSMARQ